MSKEYEPCCVVDGNCLAPANYDGAFEDTPRARCFICGQRVCVECSSRRKWSHYGRVRVCNECQINEMDNKDETIVIKRLQRRTYRCATN